MGNTGEVSGEERLIKLARSNLKVNEKMGQVVQGEIETAESNS